MNLIDRITPEAIAAYEAEGMDTSDAIGAAMADLMAADAAKKPPRYYVTDEPARGWAIVVDDESDGLYVYGPTPDTNDAAMMSARFNSGRTCTVCWLDATPLDASGRCEDCRP
jgi:hypothetical protein